MTATVDVREMAVQRILADAERSGAPCQVSDEAALRRVAEVLGSPKARES